MSNGTNVNAFLAGLSKGRPDFESSWMDDRWKKNKAKNKGTVTIWLPVNTKSVTMAYTHDIPELRPKREGGEFLKYGAKYTSPDPDIVHQYSKNKHRGKDGIMKYPPVRDPFLLLREYLWHMTTSGRIAMDTEVLRWVDPKDNSVRAWTAELLADLKADTERTREEWGVHLRAKREYVFCVVQHDEPTVIKKVRVPSSLGEKIQSAITNRIERLGDRGDPMQNPVAFQWIFDGSKQAQSKYEVQIVSEIEMTDEVNKLVYSTDVPDVELYGRPRKGDKFRIMDNMMRAAEAARFDLPIDEIFVDAWVDERVADGEESGGGGAERTTPTTRRVESTGVVPRGGSSNPVERAIEKREAATMYGEIGGNVAGNQSREAAEPQQARRRRRPAEAPADTLPVHGAERAARLADLMPCADDDCALRSHPQWQSCPACGCDFDVEDGPAVPPPPMVWLRQNSWPGATQAEADKDQANHLASQQQPKTAPAAGSVSRCWSCNHELVAGTDKCSNAGCGAYQDEIPF